MKHTIKTALCLVLAAMMLSVFGGCGRPKEITAENLGLIEYEEFGNAYIDLSIDQFNELGFEFGDSVNLHFDNGRRFDDVPYYSGYFTPIGDMLVCGYPGSPYPIIARNCGSVWEELELTENTTVTVILNERGKYKATQELCAVSCSDNREDYESDIAFANFREVTGGNVKPRAFWRSASPCDNKYGRAPYADRLARDTGVNFVLNLSDTPEEYEELRNTPGFDSPYYDLLCREGKVLLMGLGANYRAEKFTKTVASALLTMTKHEGPVLIHSVEGKDRTGFVCALLLALADASAQDIIDDYMITYDNYFGITQADTPEKYDAMAVNAEDFILFLCGAEKGDDLNGLDVKAGAENYLRAGGLSKKQIARIEEYVNQP